jgi:hypothetical protein
VGDSFLEGCANIKKIDLSYLTKLTCIYNSFLKNCKSLETLILPPNIQHIFGSFLKGCINIKKVDLSYLTHLTNIYDLFLKKCTSLETLILPSNIEYIGYGSFLEGCTKIKELNVLHMQNNCCNKITTKALIQVNGKLMNWNLNYKSLTLFVSNTNKCNSIKGKALYHFTTHIILNVGLNIQLGIL